MVTYLNHIYLFFKLNHLCLEFLRNYRISLLIYYCNHLIKGSWMEVTVGQEFKKYTIYICYDYDTSKCPISGRRN